MSLWKAVILIAFSPVLILAQPLLQFSGPSGVQTVRIVPQPNGNTLFVGTSPNARSGIQAWSVGPANPAFFTSGIKPGGNGTDTPRDATVDVNGNIWIVGNTSSDDFPLVNPIVAQNTPYPGNSGRTTGFVMELDPSGTTVKFATYLGGQLTGNCFLCASYASAIVADTSGNVYVGGSSDESNFPVTPGAYLTSGGGFDSFTNTFFFSFVVKISPAGKLIYGTFLGTGSQSCVGGSSCIAARSTSASVDAMAVDSTGALTVTESMSVGPGRISRLAPDASKLLWTTDTGKQNGGVARLLLAQDSSGAVSLFGKYAPLQTSGLPQFGTGTPTLFTQKLSSQGTLIYSSDLGQPSPDAQPAGILLDSSGNAWLAGTDSSAANALSGAVNSGADFLLQFNAAGTNVKPPLRFPRGVIAAAPVFGFLQQILIPGANGALLSLPAGYSTGTPAIVAFANSASLTTNTGFYPGALVSLFGFGLPAAPPITINGVAAKVLYAAPGQINLQVPFETRTTADAVQIALSLGSLTVQLPLSRSLGIFTSDGTHAAALNQDGSVNSAANPAAQGSIVTLYGTGAIWPSGSIDGAIPAAAAPLNQEQNGFQIVDSLGVPEYILYAGAAPGIIEGVFQINVQMPVGAKSPFTLQSLSATGEHLSGNPFTIYTQ